MLMDFMRRNTKNFLIAITILIVPAFILWGSVPSFVKGDSSTILTVGKQKISYDDFEKYYYQLREMARANLGDNYNPELEKLLNLKQQALDGMIQDILFQKEAERLHITVSDKEVQDSLKQNPAFFTNGKFDPVKWNAAISDPRISWSDYIEQERESLRNRKLMSLVQASAHVTDDEVSEEYRRQNEKVKIEFAIFRAADYLKNVKLTSDDLKAYYEAHKEEYTEAARVKLDYVELKKAASQLDFSDVETYARGKLEALKSGGDFAEMAEKYSDDPVTRPKGGDLGFIQKGDSKNKAIEEAAFSLNPGELSDLIKTSDGFYIVKVEEVKGSGEKKEVHAREIFFAVNPGEDTLLTVEEHAKNLSNDAQLSSLKEAAASQSGIEVKETPLFAVNNPMIPSLGPVREVSDILPGLEQGKTSSAIDTKDAYYVVQVVERVPERIPELSEIKDKVEAMAKADKALAVAKAKAEEAVKEVNEKHVDLAKVASQAQEAEPFTRRGYPPELPRVEGVTDAAFALTEGMAAGPFTESKVAFVVQLKEKIAADPASFDAQKDGIRRRMLAQRKQEVFKEYYENLKQKVGVTINEQLFQSV